MKLFRNSLVYCLAVLVFTALLGAAAQEAGGEGEALPHISVTVPVNHFSDTPGDTFDLYVELAAPFDPARPTVFFIADGQQFFIRPGSMARHRDRLFSDEMNVVGIVGRGVPGQYPDLAARVGEDIDSADWLEAWRLYRAAQWVEDIEAVRRALLGETGKVMLFGRSGGGALVHEYLAVHGEHVSRAFTAAPAVSAMSGFTGLPFDRFWQEMGQADESFQARLLALMSDPSVERQEMAVAFQRQNFFVSPAERDAERERLLEAYEDGDAAALAQMLDSYQVPQMAEFDASVLSIPSRVRLMEFRLPHIDEWKIEEDVLNPDIENILAGSQPVHDALAKAGALPQPAFSLKPLHRLETTQVYVLAGAHDHVVDYRGAIALTASYPDSAIFIADDGHTFPAMVEDGSYRALLTGFLMGGLDGEGLAAAESAAASHLFGG